MSKKNSRKAVARRAAREKKARQDEANRQAILDVRGKLRRNGQQPLQQYSSGYDNIQEDLGYEELIETSGIIPLELL